MTSEAFGLAGGALLVRAALSEAKLLGIEAPVLVGVTTSEGRLVVPAAPDSELATSSSQVFNDPEEATVWLELAEREDARLVDELSRALSNWARARPQIDDDSSRADLLELVQVADELARTADALFGANPFDPQECER